MNSSSFDLLGLALAVLLLVALGALDIATYRDPGRNRATRWLYAFSERQLARPPFGLRFFSSTEAALRFGGTVSFVMALALVGIWFFSQP